MLMMEREEDIKMNLSFPTSQGICVKMSGYVLMPGNPSSWEPKGSLKASRERCLPLY
jgi:hypothetical protein